MLAYITWNPDPVIFALGALQIRWYGLFYAIGFLIAITCIDRTFRHDGAPSSWTDKTFIWIVISTIVGARLGHVFFYDWEYYSEHLTEIPLVWHGGLASHGGAIAVVLCTWMLSIYMTKQKIWWLGDRIFTGAPALAVMIRLGNLMNSEIYGHPTNVPWAFLFVRGEERFFDEAGNLLACHPTQLYEAIAYAITFGIVMFLYWKMDGGKYYGLISGAGFLGIFISRPIIEIFKNDQSAFEADMTFNMGQWLSVPFIALGLFLVIRALMNGKQEFTLPKPSREELRREARKK